jgi:hypothetical protein
MGGNDDNPADVNGLENDLAELLTPARWAENCGFEQGYEQFLKIQRGRKKGGSKSGKTKLKSMLSVTRKCRKKRYIDSNSAKTPGRSRKT